MRGPFRWLADRIIARAKRKTYRKGHIYHADGSLYMGRYSLFETRWLSARVHHLVSADYDRHMHDHPWSFVSLLLRGSYIERRPVNVDPFWNEDGTEPSWFSVRNAGSLAFRRATDRHLISNVMPDTWSLFVYGPVRQWWGFFTPRGKVFWRDYPTCHENGQAA